MVSPTKPPIEPKNIVIFTDAVSDLALARALAALGHQITWTPGRGGWREWLWEEIERHEVRLASADHWRKFIPAADAVILAGSRTVAVERLTVELCAALGGRLVLDLTASSGEGLARLDEASLLESLEAKIDPARVVKAHCFAGWGKVAGVPPSGSTRDWVYVCGNDADAKAEAVALFQQLGWETEDLGGGRAARVLDPLGLHLDALKSVPIHQPWAHAHVELPVDPEDRLDPDLDSRLSVALDHGAIDPDEGGDGWALLTLRVGHYSVVIHCSDGATNEDPSFAIERLLRAIEDDRLPIRVAINEEITDVSLGARRTSCPELIWLTVCNLHDAHFEAIVRRTELIDVLRRGLRLSLEVDWRRR